MNSANPTRVAIITARGGSKRIPRKNIKPFLGEPIIAYSIRAAIEANCFTEVMVSTDDEEIAAVAKTYGASIPFFRSPRTADDFATTADVLGEVLTQYEQIGIEFDQACCIYPTAPFITPESLLKGLSLLEKFEAKSVIPVTEYPAPIWRALQINNNRLERTWPENENKRSQDLTPAYYDAGQFYWFKTRPFRQSLQLLTDDTIPLVLPPAVVQDIDTLDDWTHAELKYQILKHSTLHSGKIS